MKPTLEQVKALIADFDKKYRRVSCGGFLPTQGPGLTSSELMGELRDMVVRKPQGRYEAVHVTCPVLDDVGIEQPDNDDVAVTEAYDEFDVLLTEVLGKRYNHRWVVPPGDERYDATETEIGILFTD